MRGIRLDKLAGFGYNKRTTKAEVAERQTRYVQGVVSLRAWEFKSPLRHQSRAGFLRRPAFSCLLNSTVLMRLAL